MANFSLKEKRRQGRLSEIVAFPKFGGAAPALLVETLLVTVQDHGGEFGGVQLALLIPVFDDQAIGLDGSERFAAMAHKVSGCEVWHQDFLKLDLPAEYFDGIFANASLFHVPSQELPRVLRELWATLKLNGVLFSSNPRGENQEGWSGERYGCYHDWPRWKELLTGAGFSEIRHYYRPTGLPREQQPWLASVWRKPK